MRGGGGKMDVRGDSVGGGGGKGGGGGIGRNGHRRDLRPHEHRNGHNSHVNGVVSAGYNHERPYKDSKSNDTISDPVVAKGAYFGTKVSNGASPNASDEVISERLEKRLASVQQDFTLALHKTSEKENEKFDLIFEILSHLQNRQAKLEESVRAIKAQGSPTSYSGCSPSSAPSFAQKSGAGQNGSDVMNGMGGQLANGMTNNQQMQQFSAGMMHHGGGQTMFAAMPQVVVVQSPNAAGMQYAMPQMMSPNNSMQPMPHQMAMQYMGPGHVGVGHEMGSFSGVEVPADGIASATTPAAVSPGNAAVQARGTVPAAWSGTTGGATEPAAESAMAGAATGAASPLASGEEGQAKERDSGSGGIAAKGEDSGGAKTKGEVKEVGTVEPVVCPGDTCSGSNCAEVGATGFGRGSTPCAAEEPQAPAPSFADRAPGVAPAAAQETSSTTVDSNPVTAAVAATAA